MFDNIHYFLSATIVLLFFAGTIFVPFDRISRFVVDLITRNDTKWKIFLLVAYLLSYYGVIGYTFGYVLYMQSQNMEYSLALGVSIFVSSLCVAWDATVDPMVVARDKKEKTRPWHVWIDGDSKDARFHKYLRVAVVANNLRRIRALSFFYLLAIALCAGNAIYPNQPPPHPYATDFLWALSVLWPAALGFLVFWLLIPAIEWIKPELALVRHCLMETTTGKIPGVKSEKVRTSRWRSSEHYRCFMIANSIQRCIPALRGKLSQRHFESLERTYLSLASHMREESLRPKHQRELVTRPLIWMALTLIINEDPASAARRISKILPREHENIVQPTMFSRTLTSINRFLNENFPLFVFVGIVGVCVYLVTTGQLLKLVDFIKDLVTVGA